MCRMMRYLAKKWPKVTKDMCLDSFEEPRSSRTENLEIRYFGTFDQCMMHVKLYRSQTSLVLFSNNSPLRQLKLVLMKIFIQIG